jgi:hypothetical protein
MLLYYFPPFQNPIFAIFPLSVGRATGGGAGWFSGFELGLYWKVSAIEGVVRESRKLTIEGVVGF